MHVLYFEQIQTPLIPSNSSPSLPTTFLLLILRALFFFNPLSPISDAYKFMCESHLLV